MHRHAFTTEVKPGRIDEYLKYHDEIWPEVCAGLRVLGVTQLSIFRVPFSAASRHRINRKPGGARFNGRSATRCFSTLRRRGPSTCASPPDDPSRVLLRRRAVRQPDRAPHSAKASGPGSAYRADARCRQWEEMMDADFHGGWTSLDEVHASDAQWNVQLGIPLL